MSDTLITADRLRALSERNAAVARRNGILATSLEDAKASLAAMMRQRNDLLAVIHRDGGHYREQHGAEKAVADAIALISRERTELAAMTAERDRLREALHRVVTFGCASDGWDASVALALKAWIKAGMKDELPPLPSHLLREGREHG